MMTPPALPEHVAAPFEVTTERHAPSKLAALLDLLLQMSEVQQAQQETIGHVILQVARQGAGIIEAANVAPVSIAVIARVGEIVRDHAGILLQLGHATSEHGERLLQREESLQGLLQALHADSRTLHLLTHAEEQEQALTALVAQAEQTEQQVEQTEYRIKELEKALWQREQQLTATVAHAIRHGQSTSALESDLLQLRFLLAEQEDLVSTTTERAVVAERRAEALQVELAQLRMHLGQITQFAGRALEQEP